MLFNDTNGGDNSLYLLDTFYILAHLVSHIDKKNEARELK